MSSYAEFFLNGKSKSILYETVEIYHPSFSKRYFIVRNSRFGITAKLENDEYQTFEYYPLKITKAGSNGTLDQVFSFTVGDLGTLIPYEIARVIDAGTISTKPTVVYRAYSSDDLDTILYGPTRLQITDMPMTKEGVTFEAKPALANRTGTGELYLARRFPGLRAFL